jgi:carbamate kinase
MAQASALFEALRVCTISSSAQPFWSTSPAPLEILEARVIELLVEQNVIVICTGGCGIDVIEREDGSLTGIEAVIDKDVASALLACQLRADWLVMLTDVDALYLE